MNTESDNTEEESPEDTGQAQDNEDTASTAESEASDDGASADAENEGSNEGQEAANDGMASADGDSSLQAYDFSHPQHRLLAPAPRFKVFGQKIAAALVDALDVELHVEASVELVDSQYTKYDELIASLDDEVSIYRNEITQLSQDLFFIFERGLIASMVNRFLAAQLWMVSLKREDAEAEPEPVRELSETERRFAARLQRSTLQTINQIYKDTFRWQRQNHLF